MMIHKLKCDTPPLLEMNLARIHDKHKLKNFWEQKIENHSQMMGDEDLRMKRSALSKLREEWFQRLKIRNQHLEVVHEERVEQAQRIHRGLGT
ncbi:protein FAM240C-like [Alosa sapidissima]|uniref:protein FAM240C-like n=1 Tax=Alosa sapidissima TaxID=34773 RepID=UPI001C0945AD|nr:protein FAM240C-like [Alosa sapidissima]